MNAGLKFRATALVALAFSAALSACTAPPAPAATNGGPPPSPGGDVNPVSGTTAQGAKGQ